MQEGTHLPPASPEESNQGLWSSLNWNLFQTDPVLPPSPQPGKDDHAPSLPPLPTPRTALAGRRRDAVQTDHHQSATTKEDTTLTVHRGGKLRNHLALLLQRRPTSNTAICFTAPLLKLQTTVFTCNANPSQEASCWGRVQGAERQLTNTGRKPGSSSAACPRCWQSALSPGFQLCVQAEGTPP